jgi:hypothetical protein
MRVTPEEETMNTPLSLEISRARYKGGNPFTYSQARDFSPAEVPSEFFPTSKYWSLLNNSHEVLVGTRGCGKTILLRMLSYSLYRRNPKLKTSVIRGKQRFYGIYIPLRLQLLNELAVDAALRRRQFRFIFNCVAAGSYLDEVKALLQDAFPDPRARLTAMRQIIDELSSLWATGISDTCQDIDDYKDQVNARFLRMRANWSLLDSDDSLFRAGLLEPILGAKDRINRILKLENESTTWIACFDEAEYLKPDLQAVVNTLLRSATLGVVVKIATLPLHWEANATEDPEVTVQTEGDDFRFTELDYDAESSDFEALTNNLVAGRLRQLCLMADDKINSTSAFDDFLGINNNRPLVDVFKSKVQRFVERDFRHEVEAELLERPGSKVVGGHVDGQIKRYEPIVILRRLRRMVARGNTKVAWLVGPEMARRVTGGNPRRFIQLCYLFFEKTRETRLGLQPNAQHDVVVQFAENFCDRAKSVHREGFVLHDFITKLADYFEREMHHGPLKDVGLGFSLAPNLLSLPRFVDAIKAGIAYSYIVRSDDEVYKPVTPESRLRLANAFAAKRWLPMRAGGGARVSSQSSIVSLESADHVLSAEQSEAAINQLQLNLSQTDTV